MTSHAPAPYGIWLIVDSARVYHHALCVVSGVSFSRLESKSDLSLFSFSCPPDPRLISSQIDPRPFAGWRPGKAPRQLAVSISRRLHLGPAPVPAP